MFAFTQNPAKLSSSPYAMFFVQHYMVVPNDRVSGEFRVKTLNYEYNIERRKDCQEVICFHWEGEKAANSIPHLHLGVASNLGKGPFDLTPFSVH
jgi:hypothetical protein